MARTKKRPCACGASSCSPFSSWPGARTIDGDTVRFELDCRTRSVQQQVGEAIGEEPGFNAFASNAEVEWLDYGPLPEMAPPRNRQTYGHFGVAVHIGDEPPRPTELDVGPDARGIGWIREPQFVYAVKRYGGRLSLHWQAQEQRVDNRWERIDKVLRGIDPKASS